MPCAKVWRQPCGASVSRKVLGGSERAPCGPGRGAPSAVWGSVFSD